MESVWSLEILIQNFDTKMWSFHRVSLPDSGVFPFKFNTIQSNYSGVLSVCKEYWNQNLQEICNSLEQQA